MSVHNHGTEDGPGLSCPETLVDGKLRGKCMNDSHWLIFRGAPGWECTGCDWTGPTVADYWEAHGIRSHDDNIPF